jgi:hypothetical protein
MPWLSSGRRTMAKRKRMSPEEYETFMRGVDARQDELLRLIEEKRAARRAAEERRLRRRRLFGLR